MVGLIQCALRCDLVLVVAFVVVCMLSVDLC